MTTKTRSFVIASLLVVFVGLGTGLVAYYVGFPATAFFNGTGPEELRYMPSSASVVGYVEVREIMTSELRQKLLKSFVGDQQDSHRREFQELTGINFETDIERIVVCFDSTQADPKSSALILARGLFDGTKIEALMREHGAQVQDYKGKRLIVAEHDDAPFALTFIEPGLAAFGATSLVQHAIDLHATGGSSAATNDDLVSHIKGLQGGNAWVVGRMDILRQRANLPDVVSNQIPPITWFSVRGQVDGGLQAQVTAEAKDDESANMLRDVVRGFLALAKLQTSTKPEFQRFVQSLQLGGTGKTVSLQLEVPAQVFDALGAVFPKPQLPPEHPQ